MITISDNGNLITFLGLHGDGTSLDVDKAHILQYLIRDTQTLYISIDNNKNRYGTDSIILTLANTLPVMVDVATLKSTIEGWVAANDPATSSNITTLKTALIGSGSISLTQIDADLKTLGVIGIADYKSPTDFTAVWASSCAITLTNPPTITNAAQIVYIRAFDTNIIQTTLFINGINGISFSYTGGVITIYKNNSVITSLTSTDVFEVGINGLKNIPNGNIIQPDYSFNRSSDTTAYIAGQVINNSKSVGVLNSVVVDALNITRGGVIQGGRLQTNNILWAGIAVRVHFYNATITPYNDGDVFAMMFANAAKRLGYIDFVLESADGAATDSVSNYQYNKNLPFKLTDGNLYFVIQVKSAVATGLQVSGQSFYFKTSLLYTN
jgi:hypothetical protein